MRVPVLSIATLALIASCAPLPPEDPGGPVAGQMCGGLQGLSCGPGSYCDYPLAAQCGAADQTGTCRPVPEACTMEYAPVCGCNDRTYSNACMAAAEGISVAYRGECG